LSIFDEAKTDPRAARKLAIGIVFLQTFIGAVAQILLKSGTQQQKGEGVADIIVAIFSNAQMFAGYACYGVAALLMIAALKYGELSILYPIIAMTYVWVSILSVLIYAENMNPLKIIGLASIVLGVAVLGSSSQSRQ
jgi:multidrug transporter EmrE-like cation transporter